MRARLTIALACLPAVLLVLSAGGAWADCSDIDRQVRSALSRQEHERYDELYKSLLQEPACSPVYRAELGRLMARSALTGLPGDAPPEAIAAVFRFGRPWQALVALGDAHFDRRDWEKAVTVYQEALDDMRDTAANPKPPPAELEQRVYKRAIEARALAPNYVKTREYRGRKTGLASPEFRNFTAEAVPVPIKFEYDSSELTPEGVTAVEDIYSYLQGAAPNHVVIVGHTDPRGSDAYNDDLSFRRAEAVKSYLAQLGYTGLIDAEGRGKSEPFAPDDPTKYSQDELYAFDRRVEYKIVD